MLEKVPRTTDESEDCSPGLRACGFAFISWDFFLAK